MAKSKAKNVKKKTTRRPQKSKFGLVMTPRIRIFLIGCFLLSFAVVTIIFLGVRI